MVGKVYLVGAGPGDPELMTVKGLRLVRTADVVIHDRLIPLEVLDDVQPNAEIINAGKAPSKHRLSQEMINDLIVGRALAGLAVVRLKGGDPFVFGRGGEEALACRAAGVPFEVVPGVSSAFAVPAYAGIPLTHRHVSSAFTVFTGHEDPAKATTSVRYETAARSGGTIVILMGVSNLPQIVARLIEAGLAPDTPAACIEWGTTPRQRVVEATAEMLPLMAREAAIQSPATVVIGEAVALRGAGMAWFEQLQGEAEVLTG